MLSNSDYREISTALFGRDDHRPIVNFYDHAVPDEAATKKSGRPRYKAVVYVRMKPTAPDLTVRDVRSRLAKDEDKAIFKPEWERYLAEKAGDQSPKLDGIPGMTIVAKYEFEALNLKTVAALAAYEGDIAPYEHLRETAKKIMEVSRGTFESGQQDKAAGECASAVPNGKDTGEANHDSGFRLPPSYSISYTIPSRYPTT